MKSGTTYLCRVLRAHPSVFMSDPKEPCYFVDPRALRRNWKWPYREGYWRSEDRYLTLFAKAGAAKIVGEASTVYSRAPLFTGVPERILRFSPKARFIYLMRDPVERALSHYWHRVRGWRENRAPLRALQRDAQYVDASSYAQQLKIYLEHTALDNIYILTLEELVSEPLAHVSRLFAWLGIDDTLRPRDAERAYNVRPEAFEQVRGFGLLDRLRHLKGYRNVAPYLPERIRRVGHRLAVRSVRPHEFDTTEAVQHLRTALRAEVRELSEILGRGFPEWVSFHGNCEPSRATASVRENRNVLTRRSRSILSTSGGALDDR